MKKIILSAIFSIAAFSGLNAQTWYMVVHNADGTNDTIAANNSTVKTSQSGSEWMMNASGTETASWNVDKVDSVSFTVPDQNADQIIIKELYAGGCTKDDGVSRFQYDKGCILYNNCPQTAVVNNLCFGMGNANAQSKQAGFNYDESGNFIPDTVAVPFQPTWAVVWYFQKPLIIPAFSQVVVSFFGAIDNTQTVSNSVNYANPDYYTMYDPDAGWTSPMSTNYYPTPSDVIPTSHYLKGKMYSLGNAWALSLTSPAVFIYKTEGVTPLEFANDSNNDWYMPGNENSASFLCKKVPQAWVIDAIEVFTSRYTASEQFKRVSANLDAGYVIMTTDLGHTLYRNVDVEATMEIEGNSALLVYGYDKDPSGIDAEASIKNGAKIVYMDTNNSSVDFHERDSFSIKE